MIKRRLCRVESTLLTILRIHIWNGGPNAVFELHSDHSGLQVFDFLSLVCFKSEVFSSNQTFNMSNIFGFIDGYFHGYQKVSQTSI